MSDDTPTTDAPLAAEVDTPTVPKPGPTKTANAQVAAAVAEAVAAAEERFKEEAAKLRAEAGKHRLEKKQAMETAEAAAREAVAADMERLAQAEAELVRLADAELTVTKYRAMVDAGIPTDSMAEVIELVQGNDPESIAKSVAAAKALMGRQIRDTAVDPAQGFGSNTHALNSDGLEHSLKRVLGITN